MSAFLPADAAIRVLLQPQVTQDDIADYGLAAGWQPVGARPATDTSPYAYSWEVEDAATQVDYVWDDLVSVAYLFIRGGRASDIADLVRAAIPVWSVDDVVDRLREADTRDVRLDAILRLGAARISPTVDSEVLLLRAASDPDPWVRRAFITAAGYLGWPNLVERVRAMRSDDPDGDVRDEADIVVAAIDRDATS